MKKVRQHCKSVTLSSYVGAVLFFKKDYSVQESLLGAHFSCKKAPIELGIFC